MNQSTGKVQDTDRGERLRSERKRLGLSIAAFAEKAGISKSSQILYEKGTPPTVDYLVAIGGLGADMFFVLTGADGQNIKPRPGTSVRRTSDGKVLATFEGEPSKELADSKTGAPQTGQGDQDRPNFVRLPVYSEVRASAGPGAEPVSELVDGVMSFDHAFLRAKGANPGNCVVIWAAGDSMMPTIPDGSALIVDRSQNAIANGFISVIGVGEDLLVKRIRRRVDGLIELISDNPAYAPETLGPDALQQLRVVGRVVYFCRVP